MELIVIYLILRFARSSAYHHTHMRDTYYNMIICVMDILVDNAALLRNCEGQCGSTLDLNNGKTKLTALMPNH